MYFKQFYLGCLDHASYLIGSDGEALVVDPQRDVEQYVAEATARGRKITHVLETHLHAHPTHRTNRRSFRRKPRLQ